MDGVFRDLAVDRQSATSGSSSKLRPVWEAGSCPEFISAQDYRETGATPQPARMQPAQVGGSPLGQIGGFNHEIAHGSASGGRPGQPANDDRLGLGAALRR